MAISTDSYAAVVGIDWADQKHDFCLTLATGNTQEYGQIAHTPQAIDEWALHLWRRFEGNPILVGLEQRKGPLIYALLKYEFLVLVPVNPQTLARLRRAFKTSRAKDDPTDAALIVELMQRHGDKLQAWKPELPAVRQLRLLVEMRRRAVGDKGRICNRLSAALKCYYPQILDWFEDLDTTLLCDFLRRWPDLTSVKRARRETLHKFFLDHNVRRPEVIDRRIQGIRSAQALTNDEALIAAYRLATLQFVEQLAGIRQSIEAFDEAIAEKMTDLPDAAFFQALPGAGPQMAARLLAAMGTQRDNWPNALGLQQYAGVAPVTERSGKKSWVHWRYNCPTFLRQTFVEWSAQSIRHSFWARAYYQQQMAKGKPRQAALRALAFKWIRILHRCWMDKTPYDEARYLMALQSKGSPLIANLALEK